MATGDEASVVALARRASVGDEGALADLLRVLEPVVVRTARLIVGAGSWVAEDAAQEAMLDIARSIQDLREPGAVQAWAVRITTARALRIARSERSLSLRRSPRHVPELAVEVASGRTASLKEAFDRLPPRSRATAVLRLFVGLSEAETAQVLGCSIGTVKSNLHDARRRLANDLRDRGVAPIIVSRATKEVRR